MATGNFLLGYGRGSVGDVTFARVKGQQTAHARNRKPNNPKTKSQVSQRALFLGAVKFFTAGNQALFKFAYEDKRERESDYNAFMRHNAKRSPMITREMAQNSVAAPALYQISQGSLSSFGFSFASVENEKPEVYPSVQPSNNYANTVGGLSQYLIKDCDGWEEGDIFTAYAVAYGADQNLVDGISHGLLANNVGGITFTTRQIILNSASTEALSTYGLEFDPATSGPSFLSVVLSSTPGSKMTSALVAFVHSRNTPGGLKVSTEEFQYFGAPSLVSAMTTDAYVGAVLAQWGYSADAILQGNL